MAYFIEKNREVAQVLYNLWEDSFNSAQTSVPKLGIDSRKQYCNWYYDNYGITLVYNGHELKGMIFKSQEHFTWFMLNYS
jgi:hypothetical protein